MTNQPKLSTRAAKALDILANGGRMVERLERNSYTGREQWQTRFTANGTAGVVRGLGIKTKFELQDAGFSFIATNSTSVSTYYKLNHAA